MLPHDELRFLRLHRLLLMVCGTAYLGWWFYVRAALPQAFNPFVSRAAVVACFFAVVAVSYARPGIGRQLDAWLGACCSLATVHYFYLFDHNDTDLNWVVGSYITVIAVSAVLQTFRSLALHSLTVVALSIAMLVKHPGGAYVVFLPGMLTIVVFANVGLAVRLRLQRQLHESHERIESLFDAGFDGIAVHENGIVRQVNGALGVLLGYSKSELIGKDLRTLFAPEEQEHVADILARRTESPSEMAAVKRDGAKVSVEVLAKHDVLGGREMQQIAFRDLTERKRAEFDLVLANREMQSFSYSVAHDLRSPLRGINGYSQVLLEDYADKLDESARKYLQSIAAAAEKMGHLIDALLGLARITRTEMKREPVDLSAQAEAIAKELQAAEPDRVVAFEIQPGLVAEGDPQLLRSVLENLLRNAWKFTSRKSAARIAFGSTETDGARVYHVKDDGAGFDMAYAKRLFAPFQRLHVEGDFSGTGVGLANVQRVVERHRGRVWGEGALNEGATFYFTLAA